MGGNSFFFSCWIASFLKESGSFHEAEAHIYTLESMSSWHLLLSEVCYAFCLGFLWAWDPSSSKIFPLGFLFIQALEKCVWLCPRILLQSVDELTWLSDPSGLFPSLPGLRSWLCSDLPVTNMNTWPCNKIWDRMPSSEVLNLLNATSL